MDFEDLIMVLGIAFVPLTTALAALWISARGRARRAEAIVHELTIAPALRGQPPGSHERELGAAVEAMAIEVERIAEGQRFVTRLLAERTARDVSSLPRAVTPH